MSGTVDLAELEEFNFTKECKNSKCSYLFTESNYGGRLSDFCARHRFPKWPAVFWVQGIVDVKSDGSLLSSGLRLGDLSDTPPGTFAVVQSVTAASDPPFYCNLAESRHPGLMIELRKGWMLHAIAASSVECSVKELLYAVNWRCLGSLHGCGTSENLLPEVARILDADKAWEQSHPHEVEEAIKACQVRRDAIRESR